MALMNALLKHLLSLEIIRGAAAIIIVFYPWQHFTITNGPAPPVNLLHASLPPHTFSPFFYENGFFTIDSFFMLSRYVNTKNIAYFNDPVKAASTSSFYRISHSTIQPSNILQLTIPTIHKDVSSVFNPLISNLVPSILSALSWITTAIIISKR